MLDKEKQIEFANNVRAMLDAHRRMESIYLDLLAECLKVLKGIGIRDALYNGSSNYQRRREALVKTLEGIMQMRENNAQKKTEQAPTGAN